MTVLRCLIMLTLCLLSSAVVASDGSPQPTTSPTSSGKLSSGEVKQFVDARSTIMDAIVRFDKLASQSKQGSGSKNELEMKALLQEIAAQSKAIREYSVKIGDLEGESLAGQLIINDDVTVKQGSIASTNRLLLKLSDRLGLLEPVVHR